MELRVLRYFLAVARQENVSKAADFLYVTQPTLSRQLMELEEELGAKLFIRGSRKITLTDEGLLLRKRAEEILELVSKTEAEFLKPEEIVGGDIYIGGGETEAMRLIAKTAVDLRRGNPGVRFQLFSGNADDVLERLDKGLLDFGVLIEPADVKKYDSLRLPYTDVWGVLMRKDSPLGSKDSISPQDLWNEPLIGSRQSFVSDQISKWIKRNYEELDIVATYNLVYNASLMAEEGLGYVLTLDKLVNTEGSGALCFKPLNPPLEAGLVIVWKKYQVFSRAAKLFLKQIMRGLSENMD